jgi:hypothetical protein
MAALSRLSVEQGDVDREQSFVCCLRSGFWDGENLPRAGELY